MKGYLLSIFSCPRDVSPTNIGIIWGDSRFRNLKFKPYEVLRFYHPGNVQTLHPKSLNLKDSIIQDNLRSGYIYFQSPLGIKSLNLVETCRVEAF